MARDLSSTTFHWLLLNAACASVIARVAHAFVRSCISVMAGRKHWKYHHVMTLIRVFGVLISYWSYRVCFVDQVEPKGPHSTDRDG